MKFKALNMGVLLACSSLVGCGTVTDDRVSEYNTDGNSSISNSINGVLDGYSLEDNYNYGYGFNGFDGTDGYSVDGEMYGDSGYTGEYNQYKYNTNTTGDNHSKNNYNYTDNYSTESNRFGDYMQGAENIIGNESTNVMRDMLTQR